MALAELTGDIEQQDIAKRLGGSKGAVSVWKAGTKPRADAVRKTAQAYHDFVHCDTGELLRELLQIAYVPEPKEPTKRTPKRRT